MYAQGVLYAKKSDVPAVVPKPNFAPELGEMVKQFFTERAISKATLERNAIAEELAWSPVSKSNVTTIAFPYFRDGELVNIKYRGPSKTFWQVSRDA